MDDARPRVRCLVALVPPEWPAWPLQFLEADEDAWRNLCGVPGWVLVARDPEDEATAAAYDRYRYAE